MNPKMMLLRALVRVRRGARAALGGATACCATAWWCCFGVSCTAFGWAFAGAAMIATTVFAGLCWLISGE